MKKQRKWTWLMCAIVLVIPMLSGRGPAHADGADDFVITVKTDNPGTTTSTQFRIPTNEINYNYNVD